MNHPMMKCGHAANAVDGNGNPCCVICVMGSDTDAAREIGDAPNLEGRLAKCSYAPSGGRYGKCPPPVPSSTDLPFFEYKPTAEFDRYYCGCWGWD